MALAVNSGPLSERMCSGTPLVVISLVSVSITSEDLMLRPALIARHSLVYSSMIVSSLTALPSCVLVATKS